LALDPDLTELVEIFVRDLPERLAEIQRFAAFEDWPAVRRLAHQLKGAGGSYGFPHLSLAATELESAVKRSDNVEFIFAAMDVLAAACSAARSGQPVG
jgi:HPt (histidine-containing phosphotransfer) domain-containing protein